MQFTSKLVVLLPFLASIALAAPVADTTAALIVRGDIPKECHFVNDDVASRKMLCEYTSPIAGATPNFSSDFPGACIPDPTGEVSIICKIPEGAKGFSIKNSKRDVAVADAYKFSLVCDNTGCHYGSARRSVEQEAYKFSISIEWKRDESEVVARDVAVVEPEAYKFSISIEW